LEEKYRRNNYYERSQKPIAKLPGGFSLNGIIVVDILRHEVLHSL
jgi:hypothetical protein